MEPLLTESGRHDTIRLCAYYLWQQRGCPFGTPEIDWFQAEQLSRHNEETKKPAIVAVAEGVGAALGSVIGLVTSVGVTSVLTKVSESD